MGDLDELPLPGREPVHAHLRVAVEANAGEQAPGRRVHAGLVEQAERAGPQRFPAQEQVGDNAEVFRQVQLLVDQADPVGQGVGQAFTSLFFVAGALTILLIPDTSGRKLED